jgi:hypothetical protein
MACLGPHEAELVGLLSGEFCHYLLPFGNAHSSPARDLQTATFQLPFNFKVHSLTVHAGDPTKIALFLDAVDGEDVVVVKEPVGYALLQNQRVGVRVRQIDAQQEVLVTLTLTQT